MGRRLDTHSVELLSLERFGPLRGVTPGTLETTHARNAFVHQLTYHSANIDAVGLRAQPPGGGVCGGECGELGNCVGAVLAIMIGTVGRRCGELEFQGAAKTVHETKKLVAILKGDQRKTLIYLYWCALDILARFRQMRVAVWGC